MKRKTSSSEVMGRPPCCDKVNIKKGPWTPEEDMILMSYIQEHGPANWRSVPANTGLMRCSKSCRLRWTNYLRPGIKRGNFTPHEEGVIIQLQALLGNRWAAIASYLPQRTDNDIKNYWNTHLKKKMRKNEAANIASSNSSSSSGYNSNAEMYSSVPNSSYASSTHNISKLLQGWMRSPSKAPTEISLQYSQHDSTNCLAYNTTNSTTTACFEGKKIKLDQSCDLISNDYEFKPLHSFDSLNGLEENSNLDAGQNVVNAGGENHMDQTPLTILEKWFLDETMMQVDLLELTAG